MLDQWVGFYYWQLRTDTHPLSQLLSTCPSRKALLSPFPHMETVSETKELSQGFTARDISNSNAYNLFSTACSPLPWSSLPQCPFFLCSEVGGHWGVQKEVMGRRGECSHPSTFSCVFSKNMYIYSLYLSTCFCPLIPTSHEKISLTTLINPSMPLPLYHITLPYLLHIRYYLILSFSRPWSLDFLLLPTRM